MESPYSEDEFSHRFLLHITPVNAHALPEYDIGHVYTGQVVRVERSTGEVSWTSPIWDNSYTFRNPAAELQSKLNPSPPADDQNTASGAELFAARSGSWHSSAAKQGAGPRMDGAKGWLAGRVAGFSASAALSDSEILWTRQNLAEFIANPAQFAPGTAMADVSIADEEAQIIADFLAANK